LIPRLSSTEFGCHLCPRGRDYLCLIALFWCECHDRRIVQRRRVPSKPIS
jgi:hypothetical protein